jgi:Family of unknown function (DUF6212)
MVRLAIAVDETILPTVKKLGLPGDLPIHRFDSTVASAGWEASTGAADPHLVFGIVLPAPAESTGDEADLEPVRALLPEHLREGGIFLLSRRSERALAGWCWQRMTTVFEHLTREYARAHLALAAYREREQQLERSLAQVETAFADFRKEPLKLALRLEWSGAYVRPPGEPAEHQRVVVRQHVPLLFANVVYVDLFFNRDGMGLIGEIRVLISGGFSHAPVHDSRMALSEVRQGWKRFCCAGDELTLRQPLTIELTFEAEPPGDLMPGLSLPNPIKEHCAHVDGTGSLGRPLALQVWCGIAGLRYPRHFNAVAPLVAPAKAETLSVPADTLSTAIPYAVPRKELDFAPISYDGATQSLLVHPLGRTPTVARLAGITVRNLVSVSALVQLRHAEAMPTECAILVFRASDRPPRFDEASATGNTAIAAANWLRLEGGEWGEAQCALAEPLTGDADIYLLSRSSAETFDLAWAFFRSLQLVCESDRSALP